MKKKGLIIAGVVVLALVLIGTLCTATVQTGYTGIVINPFGPRPFYLGSDYIRSLTELEEYQKEFMKEEDSE